MNNDDFEDLDEEELKQIAQGHYFDDQDGSMDDNENEDNDDNENEIEKDQKNKEKKKDKINEEKNLKKNPELDLEPDQDLDHDLDDQNEEDDSDDDSKSDKRFPEVEQTDWIHWFCRLRGNEFFVEIDENFLKNEENLVGINCKQFIKTFLSEKPKNKNELTRELLEEYQEIREIYGLIHKRFIQTQLGMGLVREKFLDGVYGYCPRLLCNKQVMLPIGLSEDMRYSQVKVFCPLCQEVYKPVDILYGYQGGKKFYKFDSPDGIFFGTSFPQDFLTTFPDLDPRLIKSERYIPKLYGFRIFGKYGSKYYTKDQEELERRLIKYGIKKN